MSKTLKVTLVLLAVLLAVPLLARAQAEDEDEQGWTVWQGSDKQVYPFRDRWTGEPTAGGFTLTNSGSGVVVYYYGTFRVEHRSRKK